MRTAADFNVYYATTDSWHIELGYGEGHLTQAIFSKARSVVGEHDRWPLCLPKALAIPPRR